MVLINIILTIVFGLFVFKPNELKFKNIMLYVLACIAFTPILGAPFYYLFLKD